MSLLAFIEKNWMLIAVAFVSGAMLLWPLVQRRFSAMKEVGTHAATQLINRDALVLDVREPEEFASGHVHGAVNIPQADLATRLDEIPRDRPILTICQSGMRSLRSAQFLRQQGIQDVATVAGGTSEWRRSGRPVDVTDGAGEVRIMDSEWAHAGALTTNTEEPRVPVR